MSGGDEMSSEMSGEKDRTITIIRDWVRLCRYARKHKVTPQEAGRRIIQRFLDEEDARSGKAVPARPARRERRGRMN